MMVQNPPRPQTTFPVNAATAYPVFYRTYSRQDDAGQRESWQQVCDRTIQGLKEVGHLSADEVALLTQMQQEIKALPSGRWLWVGGTDWVKRPENYSGAYNCTSTNVVDWDSFGLMMDLAMQGCGTGAVLEHKYISQLPPIRNRLDIDVVGTIGKTPKAQRQDCTTVTVEGSHVHIKVGDSRQGWVKSYQTILELSSDMQFDGHVTITIDISDVRPTGERLKGFGGVANPVKLPDLYHRCAAILNAALGRQLTSVECCLLIDEAATVVVAGNVRRSAGMRQGDSNDAEFAAAKQNLWQQDEQGNWFIDPKRDALRMANHTRVFHRKPTLQECIEAVRSQFYSGEGAIQWAGEAVARANADILTNPDLKHRFLRAYDTGQADLLLRQLAPKADEREINHRLGRYGLNPCVTAETWIHTGDGPRQVKDLIGRQHSTYINGELFSTTPDGFFFTGIKPVVKLQTKAGFSLRLTPNHQVLKVTAQTQQKQYSEWVEVGELRPGDWVLLHNHRGIQPWDGIGTAAEGWLLGSLLGDGSLGTTQWRDIGLLRFWQESRVELSQYARELLATVVDYRARAAATYEHKTLNHQVINSTGLAQLAAKFGLKPGRKVITPAIEQASYEFYQGFLRGLFDADGSVQGSQDKGVSVRLCQSNLETLKAVQRMLARLGIIATIYQNRRPEGLRLLPDSQRQPSLYHCQSRHELVISQDNLLHFQELIGFQEPTKQAKLQKLLSGYQRQLNRERFAVVVEAITPDGEAPVYDCSVPGPNRFDANGLVAHNCGEIISADFHCNLSEIHLNQIDPADTVTQANAFKAGAISVAALLHHRFEVERYRYARELDPIVGVSFTGLFDFFVHAFGTAWLEWWAQGRPDTPQGQFFKTQEASYLQRWRDIVHAAVWEYCDRHGLKQPNRCTTVQPAGTKSLLTGASPGWHPPKAQRFIRRITFRKGDAVAMACYDYGYNIIPSQSDKDEQGKLLDDPFDPRCTEWLVEIPVAVSWADLPGADAIDISQFSALAQFDFYMQVQQHYTTHNTSATIELREHEIEPLATAIYEAIQQDQGYISAALLARFDANETFPRLPFEPISKQRYDAEVAAVAQRRRIHDFHAALSRYTQPIEEAGPAGCDSDKCLK